jgi:tetratricopeptide (TPR) repeat protein
LPLDVLSRAESIELLHKHRADLSAVHADAIAAELGDLPLALHLAGSYLHTYRDDPLLGDPSDFLAELRDKKLLDHPALRGHDVTHSPTGHDLHVARTFALSYQRLDASDPADATALALFGRSAYFAPGEPIPRDLLLSTLDLQADDREQARQAARGLRRLVDLGLLEQQKDGALLLHCLLAVFGQGVAGVGAQGVVEATLLADARRLNVEGYPAPLLVWQPHLRAVTYAAMKRDDKRAAKLCNALGYHLNVIGNYDEARTCYERALVIDEKVLGTEHPDTARSLSNLGALLQTMGDYDAARLYLERALDIWEKVLGAEHPSTAIGLNNLGMLLRDMGDYDEARNCYERALGINEKVLGAEHPHTARSLSNLGALFLAMGDYDAARSYMERALDIWEKVLGAEHPDIATSLNNLGLLLRDIGDYDEARPCLARVLAIRKKALGAEHPDTAISLNNLGYLLQATGDLDEARTYFERALAILEAQFGPDHPHTRTVRGNLDALDKT